MEEEKKHIIVVGGRFGKTNSLALQLAKMNVPITVMDREDEIKKLKDERDRWKALYESEAKMNYELLNKK